MDHCGRCGGTVGLHHSRAQGRGVLVCLNAQRRLKLANGETCDNRSRYRYEPLEAAILTTLPGSELTPLSDGQRIRSEIDVAMADRAALTKKVENLLDLIEDGGAALIERYRERVGELEAKDAELTRLRASVKTADATITADHQRSVAELTAKMTTLQGDDLIKLRSRLHGSLKVVIDTVTFDWCQPNRFSRNPTDTRGLIMI